MQFFYGDKMTLRILDEIDFWKQQEAEHTVVIRELVPGLEKQFVEALERWEVAFAAAQGMAVRLIEWVNRSGYHHSPELTQQVLQLTHFALNESQQFLVFLNTLKLQSTPVKSNPTAVTVINHIARESEYFIGIAQALLGVPQHP